MGKKSLVRAGECKILLSGAELRKKFLDFFAQRDHLILPSASLIPKDDPTLLLTVAGMVPFKPFFLGKAKPPKTRITTAQKCLRTPDLESVGKTARHHTFFEMLGNFSFGDYFKREAIAWAWEYLTKELGLSPRDLWITVYKDDREAKEIWTKEIGVPQERVVPLDEETNFWAAGPVGPCGPCSEIHIDLGPERGCGSPNCGVACDCDRFLEIWNLVFMEFNRDESGNLSPLPQKNIDTGMGLERIASVVQGVESNFETDLLFPLIKEVSSFAGVGYGDDQDSDVALKVIADHSRAVTFLIADGVLPANEGRGYVLRRILRRAVRYGRLLGIEGQFLNRVTRKVIELYQDPYKELKEREEYIQKIVSLEESRFSETLEQGLQILQEHLEQLKEKKERVLPGEVAFRLYDTFGFPLELTNEILAEHGLEVDLAGFNEEMEKQRERARAARLEVNAFTLSPVWSSFREEVTDFQGYSCLATRSEVRALVKGEREVEEVTEGEVVQILLDVTPFYPEGGGQVGDKGTISGPEGEVLVEDTQQIEEGLIIHQGRVNRGIIRKGDLVLAQVNERLRLATARSHTATHLLHQALRTVLGEHVQQMGSLVAPDRLRFDFSHFAPLTREELQQVEDLVNQKILENLVVRTYVLEREKAIAGGALALFGEKYGDQVRVVEIGDFSKELCGGTHVQHTSEIGFLKILTETGIGTGVRRIEAVTGEALLGYWNQQSELLNKISDVLKTTPDRLLDRVLQLQKQLQKQEKEIAELRGKLLRTEVGSLLAKVVEVGGIKLLVARVEVPDMESLRSLGDLLKEKLGSGVIILGSPFNGKVGFVSFVTRDLVAAGLHAGKIISEVAKVAGGGGGGRPEMAQAGGKNPSLLEEALRKGREIVRHHLEKR
ncbi:MAG: Alanine--tRNA ligase [Thermoanaerobacterales bacterium 50_218]|nr:MAG: Alanine--tRNA ligase [Thermoanaerobacterales bacterium 50_218]HAA89328.1 alanine--tRNA ligase [Peptococcaceae bacterium]